MTALPTTEFALGLRESARSLDVAMPTGMAGEGATTDAELAAGMLALQDALGADPVTEDQETDLQRRWYIVQHLRGTGSPVSLEALVTAVCADEGLLGLFCREETAALMSAQQDESSSSVFTQVRTAVLEDLSELKQGGLINSHPSAFRHGPGLFEATPAFVPPRYS